MPRKRKLSREFLPRMRMLRGEPREVMVKIEDGKEIIRIMDNDLRRRRTRRKKKMMSNKGQVSVLLGIAAAVIGMVVLANVLPLINDFIDDLLPNVDDATSVALNLLPVFLVIALVVVVVRIIQGQTVDDLA